MQVSIEYLLIDLIFVANSASKRKVIEINLVMVYSTKDVI